jgi:nitroreductase
MEFEAVIRSRRSIRRFRGEGIPDSLVAELVDLARHAPSSMNGQPWHFVVVRSEESKARLAEIKNRYCPPEKRAYQADFLRRAPLIVLVCVDRERSYGREVENGVLATATLLLAAHRRGLGAVYMSAYAADAPGLAEEIRQLFGIPAGVVPITMIPMGRPGEVPAAKQLSNLEKMIHLERF